MPEENERHEHSGSFKEGLTTHKEDQYREEVRREHSSGNQHAHIEGAVLQRLVSARYEYPARPPDDRGAEHEHDPVWVYRCRQAYLEELGEEGRVEEDGYR